MDNVRIVDPSAFYIGLFYCLLGVAGVVVNAYTVVMIVLNRVFRLSAYILMANIALADGLLLGAAGVACGWSYMEAAMVDVNAAWEPHGNITFIPGR